MKPTRKVSRRSFLASVAGAAAGGALLMVSTGAKAQTSDSDSGPSKDPAGRGETGLTDGDFRASLTAPLTFGHVRTRAVALFSSALSVGTVISLPLTGWLVRDHGWPTPFYAFGAVGIVWAVAWFTMVSSGRSPDVEPLATDRTIPWRRLLKSSAVWAIIINHFCGNWALYVLLAWLPSYFKTTFHVSLTNAGLLSAAPWAAYFVMANVASWVADGMILRGRSVTFVRKTMQIAALLGSGAFLLLLQTVSTPGAAMLLTCGAAGTLAMSLSGFAVNSFDIAPRHADVIWGMSNTAGTVPGIIGIAVTGWLIDRTGSYSAPFFLTAAVGLVGAVVYFIYASGVREID